MSARATTKADLIEALKWIAVADQCYRQSHGVEAVLAEIKRTAREAVEGKWGGVARQAVWQNAVVAARQKC